MTSGNMLRGAEKRYRAGSASCVRAGRRSSHGISKFLFRTYDPVFVFVFKGVKVLLLDMGLEKAREKIPSDDMR
jgi:hypothetical protein